jgi:hypothetical protein
MPEPSASVSFASLNKKQRKQILQFFNESPVAHAHATADAMKAYVNRLGHTNSPSSTILALNTTTCLQTNPALFQFLTPAQRIALEIDLQLAFYQLCVQYQSDEIEHRRQHLPHYLANIERCTLLIRNLQQIRLGKEIEAEHQVRHTEREARTCSNKNITTSRFLRR